MVRQVSSSINILYGDLSSISQMPYWFDRASSQVTSHTINNVKNVKRERASVWPHPLPFICLMWRVGNTLVYKLVLSYLNEQYETKATCHLYTPPWLPYWIGEHTSGPNSNNPHQIQGLLLTQSLRFHISSLHCKTDTGWATPCITRFTSSQLCNIHSLKLLVLCK
jgi:hypothetical protein